MISTVDISKIDMCSLGDVSAHLLRVSKQLWKVAVVGTGNHDISWANPAASLPLRVNAFATLLQILGSSTLYLSKRGSTQLDGNHKWNFVSLGRVLALLFDEEDLFGNEGEEAFSDEFLAKFLGSKEGEKRKFNPKKKGRRHVRSNFEFLNNGAVRGGSDGLSALIEDEIKNPVAKEAGGKETLHNDGFDKSIELEKAETLSQQSTIIDEESSPLSTLERREKLSRNYDSPKIDSVTDFRSALEAGRRDEDDDPVLEGKHVGNAAAASWIKAFGGSSGGRRRGFLTAPSPGLATIREDGDDDDFDEATEDPQQGPLDSLNSEIKLSKTKAPVTQFRIPKRSNTSPASDKPQIQPNEVGETNVQKPSFPPSGEDLEFVEPGRALLYVFEYYLLAFPFFLSY
jgi:hypothetical protein